MSLPCHFPFFSIVHPSRAPCHFPPSLYTPVLLCRGHKMELLRLHIPYPTLCPCESCVFRLWCALRGQWSPGGSEIGGWGSRQVGGCSVQGGEPFQKVADLIIEWTDWSRRMQHVLPGESLWVKVWSFVKLENLSGTIELQLAQLFFVVTAMGPVSALRAGTIAAFDFWSVNQLGDGGCRLVDLPFKTYHNPSPHSLPSKASPSPTCLCAYNWTSCRGWATGETWSAWARWPPTCTCSARTGCCGRGSACTTSPSGRLVGPVDTPSLPPSPSSVPTFKLPGHPLKAWSVGAHPPRLSGLTGKQQSREFLNNVCLGYFFGGGGWFWWKKNTHS